MFSRHADLAIIGQENPDRGAFGASPDLAENVVLASGRPILIVPCVGTYPHVGSRVMVAWDASREAARAVAGALHCGKPKHFQEPDVVADRHRDAADVGVKHRHTQVAGLEEQVLGRPEVVLAIGADHALGTHDHGGIVERAPLAFGDSGDKLHPVARGGVRPGPAGPSGISSARFLASSRVLKT